MHRTALLFLIFFSGHRLFAQQVNSEQSLTYADSDLIKQEKPYQIHLGHFFGNDTLYAILLDTSNDNKQVVVYCSVNFFEKVDNKWRKKKEYDSLQISRVIQARFCNYSKDTIKDYLVSADIVGTGGNETEYLFIFDTKARSLKLIKGFENIPTTSYDVNSGIITSVGLAAGIPNFEYFKIEDFKLIKVGGKEMWSENGYGHLEKYNIVNGKKVVYYNGKKNCPLTFMIGKYCVQ